MNALLWIIPALALGYLLLVVLLYVMQPAMVYYPVTRLSYTPGDIGLAYEDVTFFAEDSVRLHGWYIPASGRGDSATVLFNHGNAGNISGRLETIRLLNRLGLDVFIYDYRGYGRSEGNPTEQGTYRDAMAAWNHLTAERELRPGNILLMGRSLGGAVAVWLATRTDPAGLIIESTFTSAADLGADLYPIFPVRQLIKFEYSNLSRIGAITVPMLIAHSREDDLVPFAHGRRLYEAA